MWMHTYVCILASHMRSCPGAGLCCISSHLWAQSHHVGSLATNCFTVWKLSNLHFKVFFFFPLREPIYQNTTVSMYLASPIRLWIPLGLRMCCIHPLIPRRLCVCLLYTRLQRVAWVNRAKGEWMKAKEAIWQKWALSKGKKLFQKN